MDIIIIFIKLLPMDNNKTIDRCSIASNYYTGLNGYIEIYIYIVQFLRLDDSSTFENLSHVNKYWLNVVRKFIKRIDSVCINYIIPTRTKSGPFVDLRNFCVQKNDQDARIVAGKMSCDDHKLSYLLLIYNNDNEGRNHVGAFLYGCYLSGIPEGDNPITYNNEQRKSFVKFCYDAILYEDDMKDKQIIEKYLILCKIKASLIDK